MLAPGFQRLLVLLPHHAHALAVLGLIRFEIDEPGNVFGGPVHLGRHLLVILAGLFGEAGAEQDYDHARFSHATLVTPNRLRLRDPQPTERMLSSQARFGNVL